MSAISAWLLSIAGVVLISVLGNLVLPEGQMNKYTKVIFSFAILLTIIMPLPKLFGKDFNINNFFGDDGGSSSFQEDYLYQLNVNKLAALHGDLSAKIEDAGLLKVQVSINANVLAEKLEIFDVYVDLCDLEYSPNFASYDITKAKEKITEIVRETTLLKDVPIKFDQ